MKRILLVTAAIAALVIIGAMAAVAGSSNGTLTAVCTNCGTLIPGGEASILITGTGYQSSGHNQLTVIVWGSSNPVYCGTPSKSGAFTCNTTIDGPGWYNVMAYQNSKTVIGVTGLLID